jgi:small subunit ribosomal protein S16
MLAIRLSRTGSKKRPSFRIVLFEGTRARDGRSVEVLGHYYPRRSPEVVEVDRGRVDYRLERGARPSDTVRTLLARHVPPVPPGAADGSPEAAAR